MRPLRSIRLVLWAAGGCLSLVLGLAILGFEATVVLGVIKGGEPVGKEPIFVPLFMTLGGLLLWIGIRELIRLRRTLGRDAAGAQ
jgi:hypothetical protein